LSYAIGIAEPVSIFVDTYGTSKVGLSDGDIAKRIREIFKLSPFAIENRLKLRNPIYFETASYGHMGRTPRTIVKEFHTITNPNQITKKTVELFTWEKLDYIETIKKAFII
jgi:S-adenosylmethionine synthetase